MSKDSLRNYRDLVSIDPDNYTDRSGLFEIIESIYLQLCISDPYFNAYTEYSYYNAIKTHKIRFFKQIDILEIETISELHIYCYQNSGLVEIAELDEYKGMKKMEVINTFKFDSSTFSRLNDYIKSWFDEILISVKNK